MDQKIPFTSYDFWAYLSAGFLLLFAFDSAAGMKLLVRDSWTVVQGVVAVALAYATGQLVASASSFLFEKVLVGRLLGYPRNVLFGQPKAWKWVRRCIPGYFEPLPSATAEGRSRAVRHGGVRSTLSGVALFWPAFANARTTAPVQARLSDFLNLYGFWAFFTLVCVHQTPVHLLLVIPRPQRSCGPPAVVPHRARSGHRNDAAVPEVLPDPLLGRGCCTAFAHAEETKKKP